MNQPELSPRRLEGRRAVVTGGGSGIGRATALRLGRQGAAVAVVDLHADTARAVAAELTDAGATALGLAVDVRDEEAVRAGVDEAAKAFGGLDTLAVCAGMVFNGPIAELSLADWELVLRINLTGAFLAIKHAVPHLCASGNASIVTVGSVASLVAAGAGACYDASKGGLLQLTRSVAVELAEQGVRANCVCPGKVSTNLKANSEGLTGGRALRASAGPGTQRIAVPIDRHADPDEIASVVAFLCSDDASFLTGAAVPVDGGYTSI